MSFIARAPVDAVAQFVAEGRGRGVASRSSRVLPAIDVDVIIGEGTSASALRAGAGRDPETPLPCEDGNVAITGHRTAYGRPFGQLDRLDLGDSIMLDAYALGDCLLQFRKALAGTPPGSQLFPPHEYADSAVIEVGMRFAAALMDGVAVRGLVMRPTDARPVGLLKTALPEGIDSAATTRTR